MSYTLTFKNQAVDPVGKSPINVAVGTLNTTSTPLALTGKGAANFGKFQQENLLRLLENFADGAAPTNPTVGQLWYDSAALTLKVLVDASPQTWKSLGGIQVTEVGSPPPVPMSLGDLWFERTGSASGFLYVYTGIGRYPSTATTIGGWDQIWPQVEVFGGREEYDLIRELVDQICGTSVSAFGSGAIGRSITNLTNFGELDRDLRTKYKALLPLDANILYSSNAGVSADREITRQAVSNTLFYYNDSASPSDGYIGGMMANPSSLSTPGSIYVNGVSTPVPAFGIGHNFQVQDAYIVWDQTNTVFPGNPYFVAQILENGQWQYDNNAAWVNFSPAALMYVIGTISKFGTDNNSVYPIDKAAFMWMHAVPLVGTKVEHLKVEPNSQDWDTLLAAAKYAIARLEVPGSFITAISEMPFVSDGRQVHPTLIGLNSSTDVRYPSAARRSSRRASAIRQVQAFSETVNALNTAYVNRFSLQGVNGFSGTFPNFKPTTTLAVHCSPPSPGLSGNVPAGNGTFRVQFRFTSMDEMNRFLGSGGGIQVDLSHTGGALAGDTNFRNLLSQAGVWRITADKTRIFGQSLPLTITQPTANVGIWNGNSTGTQLNLISISSNDLRMRIFRISNVQFDLEILFASQAMAGSTAVTVNLMYDNETYMPGPTSVYARPQPFVIGDVTDAW
jgi:hypothetical protein